MYATKELNKNIAKSYLHNGDAYKDPHLRDRNNPRHHGKQFLTNPGKNTCNGSGFFDKKTYSTDPLQDNTMYLKTQPFENRKLGFGTKDAHRRDEFMSHVRTEQYRETLNKEATLVGKTTNQLTEEDLQCLDKIHNKKEFPSGLSETKFLYDIGRSQVTNFNQKSHRDTYYVMQTGNSCQPRNNGTFALSSSSIGTGVETIHYKPVNARSATTKQFYDRSHLHV